MRRFVLYLTRRSEVRYLFFGGLNTVFSYGIFALSLLALHAGRVPGDYAIAISVSWFVSNVTSFVLQRRFVFRGSGRVLHEFWKFTSVTFGSFVANLLLSWVSAEVLGFRAAGEKLVSQLLVTVILVIVTYALHKSFSFRRSSVEAMGMVAVDESDSDSAP